MSLRQLLVNLFTDERTVEVSGTSYSGTFNIEGGKAEVKSRNFDACDNCDTFREVVQNCKSCGRKKGNNVSFLAGRGDGVYSGLTVYSNSQHVCTLYVFDEDNAMATAFSENLDGNSLAGIDFNALFLDAVAQFMELPAAHLGDVDASFSWGEPTSVGFLIGDLASSREGFATVDHSFADGPHSVYLFSEPILASDSVQLNLSLGQDAFVFDRGYEEALRPRVAAVISDKFSSKVMKLVDLQKKDWARQAQVWQETYTMSNMAGGNGGVANLFNGLFWLAAQRDQDKLPVQSESSEAMSFFYQNKAIGYFFAGALNGNEECRGCVQEVIALDEPGTFLDPEVLRGILGPRGIPVDAKVLGLVKELS